MEENSLLKKEKGVLSPRKLPEIKHKKEAEIRDQKNSTNEDETIINSGDVAEPAVLNKSSSSSVAYISERLIRQLTNEHQLELIKNLTIHLPKDKLNKKIKYIENLEKVRNLQTLNLSNNIIDKIQKLECLVELKELNLSNNNIRTIEGLDSLVKLHTLNLNANRITTIPASIIKKLRCLKVLKLANNQLETLLDVTKLRCLQDLTNIDLRGNPFCALPHYRLFIVFQLRSLEMFDNEAVTREERLNADERFGQEEVQRLEKELTNQEKRYAKLAAEKNEADAKVAELTKNQELWKTKEIKQKEMIDNLQHDIGAKNGLLKAKNCDLIRASENQYRLEQELVFYKLDAKFEMLGELPIMDDLSEVNEDQGLNDSAYIGKATYKRNAFTHEHYIKDDRAQLAHIGSLKTKYENRDELGDNLDQEISNKRSTILQLQGHLEKLVGEVDEKSNQLRQVSDKLALLEISMANQSVDLDDADALAREKMAEKIQFIKRLQEAAEELQQRMNRVAEDLERKQKELAEMKRNNKNEPNLHKVIALKEAEFQDVCDELNRMKEDMEVLKDRIKNEKQQVETLKKQLRKEGSLSGKDLENLKEELEDVIDGMTKRNEQQEIVAKEQEETIVKLEKERDYLRGRVAKNNELEETIQALQEQLEGAIDAYEKEQVRCGMLEERGKDLEEQLSINEKNSNLGRMETQQKLEQLGKENDKLQEHMKQLKHQLERERNNAKARVERDQERISKALEAAKLAGDKDNEIKALALELAVLKERNEELNDRLKDTENAMKQTAKESINKDDMLRRLQDLLDELNKGKMARKHPRVGEYDDIEQCLTDFHQKYTDLANELQDSKEKGKLREKQAKLAIEQSEARLAQITEQLNAAEKGLKQLSQENTEHAVDVKNLEDNISCLQENLRIALVKAEEEVEQRVKDKADYEEIIKSLEDEVKKLHDAKKNDRERRDKELDQLRSLAQKQKERLEKEIRQLENELKRLKDRHKNELLRRDKKLASLEDMMTENQQMLAEKEREEDEIKRELHKLKSLVLKKTQEETQDIMNNKNQKQQMAKELEKLKQQMKIDANNAHNKIRRLEQLLNEKEKEVEKLKRKGVGLEHDMSVVTGELEELKQALFQSKRFETEPTVHHTIYHGNDKVSPRTRYHSTPVNHDLYQSIHHHHYDNRTPPSRAGVVPPTRVVPASEEVHYHHYDHRNNTSTTTTHQTPVVQPTTATEEIHHHHYDNNNVTADVTNSGTSCPPGIGVPSTPASPQHTVHHLHHKMKDKKKKTRKKDYCNVSEHEDLADEVSDLENELATSHNHLYSQISENKLSALRSDLKDLENTVTQACRNRKSNDFLTTKLTETIAKFQDHMLTIMDHQANLASSQTQN